MHPMMIVVGLAARGGEGSSVVRDSKQIAADEVGAVGGAVGVMI